MVPSGIDVDKKIGVYDFKLVIGKCKSKAYLPAKNLLELFLRGALSEGNFDLNTTVVDV